MYKSLLILALYLPFQVALNPASGIDLASIRIFILVLFFVWLADGLKNKKVIISNNIQAWLVIIFLFLNLLSVIVARNTDWSIRKLLFLFSIFPIYFIASTVIKNQERMVKIAKALVASGTVAAILGIMQFFLQFIFGQEAIYSFWAEYLAVPFLGESFAQAVLENPSWLVNVSGHTYLRAAAVFPDPHMLSFYLGLLIPFAVSLFLIARKKWLFFSCTALIVADLLTFSRGGYLGLFAGLVAALALFWNKLEGKYKIGFGSIFILSIAFMLIPSPISQRAYSIFNLKEGSNKGRLEIWRDAAGVIEKKPLLGAGVGNYALEIKPSAGYREPIYAHNTYLDITAETGIVNGLAWIGILFFSGFGFWRKAKQDHLFCAGLVSVVIFSTHSMVETAIYSPAVLTLLLIIISFSNIKTENEKST